jgi:class 3 adenylate cyclase
VADTDSPATPDLERRLATILSADVAEYSRLMAEDEERTLRIFRGHSEVFNKLVTLHRGRVFNTAGDAILAEFGSAVEAVRCATEIQAALRTRNDQLPDDRQVRFRIGVNLGDVMVQKKDLLGDGVNVAARLQTAAEPGGICISGGVYDQIRNKLSLSFKPLGELNYKNIPQAVRTFAIAEAEGLGELPSPVSQNTKRRPGFPIWAVLAAALLLICGAGFWAYSDHQRTTAEIARQAQLAAEKRVSERARQQAEVERQATEAAQQRADAERRRIEKSMRRPTEAEREENADAAQRVAIATPEVMRTSPVAPRPAQLPATAKSGETAEADGLYRGPICYGPGEADPARCFTAQAIVQKGKISGQWPGLPGVTMYLAGNVSPSGDVTIHMHAKRSDGSHGPVMDLAGTLHDGQLDAEGSWLNGRTVTMNWLKN